ncbi:MAG: TOBE domain-containing protein, partial [Actinobacteria bacterium]|nr:TOBE domain-containing protein [Actinomycetota bacterium]
HRVAVLRDGKRQQCDTPRSMYDRPANAFVACFIGSPSMNLRTVKLVPGGAQLGDAVVPLTREVVTAASEAGVDEITLGLRPESFSVTGGGEGLTKAAGVKMQVDLVEELGADAYVYGSLPGDDDLTDKRVVVRFDGRVPPSIGSTVTVNIRTDEAHVFHPETGLRLG